MCGRIAAYTPPNKVALALDAGIRVRAEPEPEWRPSYNVPPARRILAVRIDKEGARSLGQFGWGLIPHWAKDPKIGSRAFNARADTVAQKPMFRSAFRSKRCLVPVDGFYEWKREGADKRPYFFTHADENLTVFARNLGVLGTGGAWTLDMLNHHHRRESGHGGRSQPHARDPGA